MSASDRDSNSELLRRELRKRLRRGNSNQLFYVGLISIVAAAAVFIGGGYLNTIVKQWYNRGSVTVRTVEVAASPEKVNEQTPPPSPEAVMRAYWQAQAASTDTNVQSTVAEKPVLTGESRSSTDQIPVKPLPLPALNGGNGTGQVQTAGEGADAKEK